MVGCGGEQTADRPPPAGQQVAAGEGAAPSVRSESGASVAGAVKFEGAPPPRKKLDMNADPVCASRHAQAALSEAVVVNGNGTLRNVFVYVKKGLEGKRFAAPTAPVALDQNGCMYTPHVVGVQVGQALKILNSDGTLHNIHPKPKVNQEKNWAMPKFMKEKVTTEITAKPEVMIPVRCDVHPWMQSYIGVVDHPFFGVTGDAGTFELKGLPAGKYTVEAWHEICGSQMQEVTVAEGGTASANFSFKLPN